nr:hypothetical protein [Tanacetum cinerariifolium]
MSIEIRKKQKLLQLDQWANLSTYRSKRFNSFCYDDDDDDDDDDDEDYTIAVTRSFPIEEPDNCLSMGDEQLDTIPTTESDEFIKSSVENLIPIPCEYESIPEHMCDVPFHDNSPPLNTAELKENFNGMIIEIQKRKSFCNRSSGLKLALILQNVLLFSAMMMMMMLTMRIILLQSHDEPVLSTEEPDNSLSMGDEHLDTISATESDEFIKSGVENLIPIPIEFKGILEHMFDVHFHDNSPPLDVSKDQFEDFSESNNEEFSSIDDDSFSFDKIDYVEASPPDSELVSSEVMEIVIPGSLNANPSPSFDFKTKCPSTSLNSLLEETNTLDSLSEFETFCFGVEEISSGNTTTPPDTSLPEYEVFYDDHVKEISSGSPTTHSDSSLYASFIFDLSINPFPPADRSDFYEFADEFIPFISLPEYDCFLFKVEPNSRDFTKDMVEDISPTKEPQVHNTLPTYPSLQLNMKF